MRKLLDFNPDSNVSHVFHWDNETECATIQAVQNVDAILENNKARSNEQGKRFAKDSELGTHIASLPLPLWQELATKGILRDAKAFKRWLNDPDNRFFRTHEAII